MSGTRAGGLKSSKKIMARDPDFYKRIGKIGGSKTFGNKGFAVMDKDKLREAARKGGRISRLPHIKKMQALENKIREEIQGV